MELKCEENEGVEQWRKGVLGPGKSHTVGVVQQFIG